MDKYWSACHVLAALLWVIALTLAVIDLLSLADVAPVGMISAAAAGTLNIRRWISDSARRESVAFDLGREAGIRSIHRP